MIDSDAADVMVACASQQEADALARVLVEQRLAACAQTWPISSMYRWQGRVEQATEVQLLVKTRADLVPRVCEVMSAEHSYDLPAITVVPGVAGTAPTAQWLAEATRQDVP